MPTISSSSDFQGEAGAPVTEIAGDDEECVCVREVRCENVSECFLFRFVDGPN